MKSGQSYNKKMNLNNDKAIWDCIRLKYNTSTNERIIIIILRRKFIPPLYTSFQDIMIAFHILRKLKIDSEYQQKLPKNLLCLQRN